MLRRTAIALIVTALSLPACSSDGGNRVTLDEYTVRPEPRSAEAGEITFDARNVGALAHQLLVLETDRPPDDLPVKGGIVRLDKKGIDVLGEIELVAAGKTEKLTVDLEPGEYQLICNIAGHYELGMRAPFRVAAGASG